MADLDFAKDSHGNACRANRFWNQYPELCAVKDWRQCDGKIYIIGPDGKRIQDVWEFKAGKWIAKPKKKKSKVKTDG